MGPEEERPQTFVEWVLALLEERFPWLGSERDEPVGGGETIDQISELHRSLIQERRRAHRKDDDPET